MKKILLAVLPVLFYSSLSLAADDVFNKLDKNKDGKISQKEYIDAVTKTFNKYDKDGNGILTKEEIAAIDKAEAEKILKEADTNKNGQISKEEFLDAAKKRFPLLDKNNDGIIDRKELNAARLATGSGKTTVAPFVLFTF